MTNLSIFLGSIPGPAGRISVPVARAEFSGTISGS